jgi:hypothetical protein
LLDARPADISCQAYGQTVGAALTYSTAFEEFNFPPDGLVGLGYEEISVYNSTPLFQTLVAQGCVTHPQFAFKLASTGSELYLGGTNPELYEGFFTYIPVTTQVSLDLPTEFCLTSCDLRRAIGKLSSAVLSLMIFLFH